MKKKHNRVIRFIALLLFGTVAVVAQEKIEKIGAKGEKYYLPKKEHDDEEIENAGKTLTIRNPFGKEHSWKNGRIGGTLSTQDAKQMYKFAQERQSRLRAASRARTGSISPNWASLGPANPPPNNKGLGRVYRVTFHPTDPTIVYAISENGGIWKKAGNAAWVILNDSWARIGATDLVISPTNPNIMYASTGQATGVLTIPSIGVMKSTDGGTSWTMMGLYDNQNEQLIHDLVIHPTNPDIVIANTRTGLHRTLDGGLNWAQVQAFTNNYSGNIVYRPNDPTVLYATMENGFYKSTDGGATWILLNSLPSLVTGARVAVTPANPNVVWVVQANVVLTGLYKSLDGGSTFTEIANSATDVGYPCAPGTAYSLGSQTGYGGGELLIAVSPTNANDLYLGQVFMCHSTDGGTTWSTVQGCGGPNSPYVDNHAIEFHPTTGDVYVGCDGGLHRFKSTTNSWEILHNDLPVALQYALAVSPDGNRILVGNQDVQTFKYDKPGNNWIYAIGTGGDGQQPAFAPTNGSIAYASTQGAGELYRSTDGGNNFTALTLPTEMNNEYAMFSFTALQVHPTNAATLYVGKGNIWKSTNDGVTWNKISDFQNNGNPVLTYCMKVAPSNPNVIYVGNNVGNGGNGLDKTTDGGVTWTKVCDLCGGVTDIEIKDDDPNTFWTVSAFSTPVKSTDGGATWQLYNEGLPWIGNTISGNSSYSIVYQKGTDGRVYVSTHNGVYYRDNTMSQWEPFDTNLPNCTITDLEIDYANGRLLASTHGRGLWATQIPMCPTNVVKTGDISGNETVVSGTFIKGNTLNIIQPGAAVTYDAKTHILLEPKFETKNNSTFKAQIGGCN